MQEYKPWGRKSCLQPGRAESRAGREDGFLWCSLGCQSWVPRSCFSQESETRLGGIRVWVSTGNFSLVLGVFCFWRGNVTILETELRPSLVLGKHFT